MQADKKRRDAGGDSRGATLGDLLRLAGAKAGEAPEPAPAAGPRLAKRLVVRTTRKGHGGKTVTELLGVLDGHEPLIAELKQAFGVGVRQEGEVLLLQGDQATRLTAWLERSGSRVIRG